MSWLIVNFNPRFYFQVEKGVGGLVGGEKAVKPVDSKEPADQVVNPIDSSARGVNPTYPNAEAVDPARDQPVNEIRSQVERLLTSPEGTQSLMPWIRELLKANINNPGFMSRIFELLGNKYMVGGGIPDETCKQVLAIFQQLEIDVIVNLLLKSQEPLSRLMDQYHADTGNPMVGTPPEQGAGEIATKAVTGHKKGVEAFWIRIEGLRSFLAKRRLELTYSGIGLLLLLYFSNPINNNYQNFLDNILFGTSIVHAQDEGQDPPQLPVYDPIEQSGGNPGDGTGDNPGDETGGNQGNEPGGNQGNEPGDNPGGGTGDNPYEGGGGNGNGDVVTPPPPGPVPTVQFGGNPGDETGGNGNGDVENLPTAVTGPTVQSGGNDQNNPPPSPTEQTAPPSPTATAEESEGSGGSGGSGGSEGSRNGSKEKTAVVQFTVTPTTIITITPKAAIPTNTIAPTLTATIQTIDQNRGTTIIVPTLTPRTMENQRIPEPVSTSGNFWSDQEGRPNFWLMAGIGLALALALGGVIEVMDESRRQR